MPDDAEKLTPEPQPEAYPESTTTSQRKRRRWGRKLFRDSLILCLTTAIYHRPLFHTGLRLALIKVAARQNVTLYVKFSGTIFTNLDVRDVSAYPTGKAPSPVEKITIESVRL